MNIQGSFFGQTVAIRFGLSESDIEALEVLIDSGAATAGRLSELTGSDDRVRSPASSTASSRRATSDASPDPADRRRVIVEVVPEKVATVREDDRPGVGTRAPTEIGDYSDGRARR